MQKKYGVGALFENPHLVTLTNSVITAVTETTVSLSVEVVNGVMPAEITVHWGETPAQLTSSTGVVVNAIGTINLTVQGLLPGTIYYAKFSAVNTLGEKWEAGINSFITDGPPIVAVYGPNNASLYSATIEGAIIATSGAPATATFYWGTSDAGANSGVWEHAIPLGAQGEGALHSHISGLEPNHVYYYRLYAANALGARWSASQRFTTPYVVTPVKPDNLVLWLRADLGIAHSNGLVYAWEDQSNFDTPLKTATAIGESCPVYEADFLGGRAGIRFDGVNDMLAIAHHNSLNLGTGAGKSWCVLAVYQRAKSGTQCIFTKGGPSSVESDWRFILEDSSLIWGTGHSSDSNAWLKVSVPNVDAPHVAVGTLKQSGEAEGTKTLYIDGHPYSSETYLLKASANNSPLNIGACNEQGGSFKGVVAEIMVYNRMLNDDDLNNAGWYLQEKYGISGEFEYRPPRGSLILLR